MTYTHLLFDLDGTLTDSGPGIMNSAAYALEQMGFPVGSPEGLLRFVGPPLSETFQTCYGVPRERVPEAIRLYRYRYNECGGIFENSPYEGIYGCLETLREMGKKLFVATSKPLPMARRVLEHYELLPYFNGVYGGSMDESGRGCTKAAVVEEALAACEGVARDCFLMIGDRKHDIIGAHENGIACAGVLWGYGSRQEFVEAGAEYIVRDYQQLWEIVR